MSERYECANCEGLDSACDTCVERLLDDLADSQFEHWKIERSQ